MNTGLKTIWEIFCNLLPKPFWVTSVTFHIQPIGAAHNHLGRLSE
ncbi:hypothetical protein SAMN05216555_104166 [Arthrobacter cupressi]|uniref:Uncharacterized protein n=1 Tax=Arthrobacter cupressi TaxID=1045773 RepID=A0A1G8N7E3_9MICC|nr:hypothetical protein [Arthrobacter cupressi]SDI76122.1 hypothetical protein SAMN05216555_104166 [Arthrobacter cupressi]